VWSNRFRLSPPAALNRLFVVVPLPLMSGFLKLSLKLNVRIALMAASEPCNSALVNRSENVGSLPIAAPEVARLLAVKSAATRTPFSSLSPFRL